MKFHSSATVKHLYIRQIVPLLCRARAEVLRRPVLSPAIDFGCPICRIEGSVLLVVGAEVGLEFSHRLRGESVGEVSLFVLVLCFI